MLCCVEINVFFIAIILIDNKDQCIVFYFNRLKTANTIKYKIWEKVKDLFVLYLRRKIFPVIKKI